MIDKTTIGVTAEQEEVEAVLHNLCGYHLAEPDPLFRYNVLTREQVLYEALAAAIKRERGRALADLLSRGQTLTQIATSTNLQTRQRVQRLVAIARAAEQAVEEVQAASRDFDERLAAVEATLDEVVSGFTPVVTPELLDEPEPSFPESSFPESSFPVPSAREPIDEYYADDPDAFIEPTQTLPALRPLLHPTKEMPSSDDTVPWWRRNRDTVA